MLSFLPESLTLLSASILIIASFFTSALTASVGVGGGLLMLALMTYIIPIFALIPVHGVVQLGSNMGRSYIQRDYINWRIVWFFLAGSIIGVTAGAMLIVELEPYILKGLLGAFIIIVVWIKLPKVKNASPALISTGGLVTSFATMFAGATGPLVAVFLSNLFSEHRKMVATHGMTMSVQHALKIVAFGLAGFAFWDWLPLIGAIVISGYAGSKFGSSLLGKISEEKLKLGFKLTITLIGLDLLRNAFV